MSEESFQNNFFDTEHLKADLKGRSVRGGAVTMAAQGVRFFLQIGSTVVLARLLTPQDFGLIAMVTAVTGFVMMFKDMGLSMATVQRAEVNHNQISTLFWINVILSLGVMLVTAALAPAIAWFYGEPRLTWITLALAGAFIFGGFTIQHQALLRRQMRFGTLAIIGIISMSVGIVAAIIAAWYGAGYWALVIMQLAGSIAGAIAVWLACGWRPSLPVRRSGVREMLAFGGNLTGFNFVNYFARNADNLLIGKFWGTGSLGLYSKAYSLLTFPLRQLNAPLSAVAIPALSRLQDSPEQFRKYYLKVISLICFITMPGVVFMIVMSKEIILIILGQQWVDASSIFSILGISALIQPIYNTQGWLHVSIGRTDRMLRWGLVGSTVIVISFLIGIPFGAMGVALCYTIATYLIVGPCLWYAGKPIGLSFLHIISTVWKPFVAAVTAGLLCWYILKAIHFNSMLLVKTIVGFVLLSVVYVCLTIMLHRGMTPLLQFYDLFHHIRSRNAQGQSNKVKIESI